jgi:hypothetical protein
MKNKNYAMFFIPVILLPLYLVCSYNMFTSLPQTYCETEHWNPHNDCICKPCPCNNCVNCENCECIDCK